MSEPGPGLGCLLPLLPFAQGLTSTLWVVGNARLVASAAGGAERRVLELGVSRGRSS